MKRATATESESGAELTFAVKIFKVSLLKRRRMWDSQVSGYKTAFDDVLREIAIMKRLDHENVMVMHDVVDDSSCNKLYMVRDERQATSARPCHAHPEPAPAPAPEPAPAPASR